MDDAPGPASTAALRAAVRHGREPPPAQAVALLKSYRWFVVGTVCVGAFMGQVDSSIAQMLLPRENEGQQKEKSEQRRIGQKAGDIACRKHALAEQRQIDERGGGALLGANEQRQQSVPVC